MAINGNRRPSEIYDHLCETNYFESRYKEFREATTHFIEEENPWAYLDLIGATVNGVIPGDLAGDDNEREEVLDSVPHFDFGQRELALNDLIRRIVRGEIPYQDEFGREILQIATAAFNDKVDIVRATAVEICFLVGSGDIALSFMRHDHSYHVQYVLNYPPDLKTERDRITQ